MAVSEGLSGISARAAGLVRCPACGTLQRRAGRDAAGAGMRCRGCGGPVHARTPRSLQRTWAFLIAGLMAYVPANLLPIMDTRSYTGRTSDTIMSGVLALADHGSPGVALIVFVASICIPLTKFVVIGGLALSLHFGWSMSEHVRHRLHTVTELIGRWSMIDVFVVAVLAALIQLGSIMTITPGAGINAFALSVILTMFAALSLDARLIWDYVDDVTPDAP